MKLNLYFLGLSKIETKYKKVEFRDQNIMKSITGKTCSRKFEFISEIFILILTILPI